MTLSFCCLTVIFVWFFELLGKSHLKNMSRKNKQSKQMNSWSLEHLFSYVLWGKAMPKNMTSHKCCHWFSSSQSSFAKVCKLIFPYFLASSFETLCIICPPHYNAFIWKTHVTKHQVLYDSDFVENRKPQPTNIHTYIYIHCITYINIYIHCIFSYCCYNKLP